jgi:hypothetical protein
MGVPVGLHEVFARLMYEKGRLSPRDVDVRFDPPRRDWITALTRPTLNFFLFDVRENTELRHSNLQTNRQVGSTSYRLPPRRFDLRYMVSAITTRVEDEHLLLWHVLTVLLKHSALPNDILPDVLRVLDPPLTTQVSKSDEDKLFVDLWNGFEVSPHPALLYVVTAPMDLDIVIEAPLVLTRTTRYMRTHEPNSPLDIAVHIGGVLRDRDGQPVPDAKVSVAGRASAPSQTDTEGRFVLVGVPHGALKLNVQRNGGPPQSFTLTVPSDEYELVLS